VVSHSSDSRRRQYSSAVRHPVIITRGRPGHRRLRRVGVSQGERRSIAPPQHAGSFWAGGYVLQDAPAPGQQREPAFADAAQGNAGACCRRGCRRAVRGGRWLEITGQVPVGVWPLLRVLGVQGNARTGFSLDGAHDGAPDVGRGVMSAAWFTRWSRCAVAAASMRFATPSLVRIRETCTLAVFTEMNSSSAI
jgi:hypothetical protein